jgi:regulator of sirC expression with transglutaminase-like and TPR domain
VAGPDAGIDLAEAALLIACEEYPDLDVLGYVARLDSMGDALRDPVASASATREAVAALGRFLFEEQGFRGNSDEYYDPRNSFLNDVLDRRTGIPISLSVVYLEVARRAGLRAWGVGLPGHFIVCVAGPEEDVLVDPFHGGTLLSEADCQERLDRIFAGRVKVEPPMLAGCGPKQILSRMLRNLKGIYAKTDDHLRALGAVELLLRLEPDSAEDLRDRGFLHADLDCYALAVRDLEVYLTRVPGAPEAGEILDRIAVLRQRAARLN